MNTEKGYKGFIKGKSPYNKGIAAWNKGITSKTPRCPDCKCFIKDIETHICKKVEKKGNRFCRECGKQLNNTTERYRKICSRCGKILQRKAQKELRLKLIISFGSKCHKCGYNKYNECLEFHHTHKEDKKSDHFLKQIIKRPERFNLFCNRCHREQHIENGDFLSCKGITRCSSETS